MINDEMAKAVKDPLARQCGNCSHWDSQGQDARGTRVGECCGVPPTPIPVGANQALAGGRVSIHFELVRPMMASNARPCGFHKPVAIPELGRTSRLQS